MERTPADERIHASDLVGSVQRALRVLEVVAQSPDGITAKAVARRLDLALSTTYHLLNTLAADVEEFQLGQACLGVPVVGVNRTVSGCVALSVPAAGFDAARPRLERHLRRAAERTSRALALTG